MHRIQHKNGECECEVIFDQEERERRARSVVLSKGKEREYDGRGGHGNTGFAGRGGRGGRGGFGRGGGRFGAGHQRGGFYGGGQDGNGDASSGLGNARGGFRGGNQDFGRGNLFRSNRQVDQFQQGPPFTTEQFEQLQTSYNIASDAKINAHQYHGYNGEEAVPGHDLPTGYSAYIHPTASVIGQPGVGMKWFDVEPAMQPLLQLPPGVTLPPLPAPLSASQHMVYQTPVHQAGAYASNYQTPDPGEYGRAGYQIPINGPGLVYQKAASEPSNTIESPQSTESAGTGYATAMSNGHSYRMSTDKNTEGPMVMDIIFNTPTMKTRTMAENAEDGDYHHLEQQAEDIVLFDPRTDDAGEGSRA